MADRVPPFNHMRPILPPDGQLDECVEEDGAPVDFDYMNNLKRNNYFQDIEKHDSALELSIDSDCYSLQDLKSQSHINRPSKCVVESELSNYSSQSICRDLERKLKVTDDPKYISENRDVYDSGVGLESHDSGLWDASTLLSSSEQTPDAFLLAYPEVSPEQAEIYDQDEDGDTQLHMAIIQLVKPVAFYMISKSPNYSYVNLMNDLRQTPLHLAVITNQPDVVRQLMIAGGQVDRMDNKGNTPLHIASKEGHWECVEALTRPVYYEETLGNAYKIPFQRIPQNLETVNYEGQTCLHLAADNYLRPHPKQSYLRIIEHLLNKGADVNAADGKSGRTILHYTAEHGNNDLLSVILMQQDKVNLNARTYAGKTPMMLAFGRGFHQLARKLYESGAEVPPYVEEDQDSSEEMSDEDSCGEYDDICIGGQPVQSPR